MRTLEKGSVLIITLLLMVMLMIITVAQISQNSTHTHIAANSADAQIAFQTAEGALNEATNNLIAGNFASSEFLSNSNGLYLFDANNAPIWTTVDWSNSSAVIRSYQGRSHAQAAYMIEQLPSVIRPGQSASQPAQVYRITVRAIGASGESPVILQSTEQLQQ